MNIDLNQQYHSVAISFFFFHNVNMDSFVSLRAAQVDVQAINLQSFKLDEYIRSMSSNGLRGISGCWVSALQGSLHRATAGAAHVVLAIDPSSVM